MRVTNAGDLNRSFSLSQAYARTKARLQVLTREVSTERRADVAGSLRGDTRGLASIENRLGRISALDRNVAEVGLRLDASQEALGSMQNLLDGLGTRLVAAPLLDSDLKAVLTTAESNLEAALGFMNTESAGQFVFSGTKSGDQAVVGKAQLMDQLVAVTAGMTTANDVAAAISTYFDAPAGGGGYLDLAVKGSLGPSGPVSVGAGTAVAHSVTAADPALREMLKGLSMAVLAARGSPVTDQAQRGRLTEAAGKAVLGAETALTATRAGVGVAQERVDIARARNATERNALETARNGIISADPYEAASALAETQVRLETLYAITARLSRLTLAERL